MNKRLFFVTALSAALSFGLASAQSSTTTTTAPVPTFSDVPAGHWAKDAVDLITQRGLIQGFPDGTFRGNENLTRYQAALIFYRLIQTGALTSPNSGLSSSDLATITKGMQDVSAELAAVSSRVSDLEKLTADQQTTITDLQNQIKALPTGGDQATTDRIDALEAKINGLPANVASAEDLQALTARVAALEGKPAGASSADVQALTARVAALEAAQNAANTTTTAPVTPGDTTTVVVGEPAAPAVASDKNVYVGLGVSYPFTGSAGLGYSAVVGVNNLFGGFGVRGDFDYLPSAGGYGFGANLTYNLGSGAGLNPYVGVGGGLVSSNAVAGGGNASDYFAQALVGIDYRFTDSLGVFAEADGKYGFSGNGVGAVNGLGFGAKGGLKVFF